jgi:hypothetical protein
VSGGFVLALEIRVGFRLARIYLGLECLGVG